MHHASSHGRETNNNNNNNNNPLIKRFLGSINSDATREGALAYIHAYMRFYNLYEGESQEEQQQQLPQKEQDLLNNDKILKL